VRFVTYDPGEGPRAGMLRGEDRVLDACGASLRELIERGDLREPGGAEVELSAVKLLPPVPDPDKIICIGLNYVSHAREAGLEPPEVPTFFAKFRNALAPPGAAVKLPAYSLSETLVARRSVSSGLSVWLPGGGGLTLYSPVDLLWV
jgi:2-keto-4-pentenoate hydratase/2-oxohepta-3-ene-1,7-dioic acid hydratase in catechol pathway